MGRRDVRPYMLRYAVGCRAEWWRGFYYDPDMFYEHQLVLYLIKVIGVPFEGPHIIPFQHLLVAGWVQVMDYK